MMMNFFSSSQDARDTLQDDLLIRYHDIRQGIYHNLTQNDNVKAFLKETYGDGRARARARARAGGARARGRARAGGHATGRERPEIEKSTVFIQNPSGKL